MARFARGTVAVVLLILWAAGLVFVLVGAASLVVMAIRRPRGRH